MIGPMVENVLAPRMSSLILAGFPSGQRDQTVNLTAMPSKVRILLPPPLSGCCCCSAQKSHNISSGARIMAGMVQW